MSRRVLGAIIFGFWTFAAGLAFAGSHHPGKGLGVALHHLADNWAWAALTPLIFWLGRRFEPERGRLGRRLSLHVTAAVLIGVLWGAISVYSHEVLEHPERPVPPLGEVLEGRLVFGFADGFLIYVAILMAGLGLAYYGRYRTRLEQASVLRAELAQARVQALTRRLQPHFLFNTLNTVSGLVERDAQGTRRVIARLSAMLRAALDEADEPEVPLGRELRLLDHYVEILRIRFGDRLEIRVEADPDSLQAKIPPLLLQPLVENAVEHGVMGRIGAGLVTIRTERLEDRVVIEVEDDGPGPILGGRKGGGLSNVVGRLTSLYGERGHLSLAESPSGGTTARVELPYRDGDTHELWSSA